MRKKLAKREMKLNNIWFCGVILFTVIVSYAAGWNNHIYHDSAGDNELVSTRDVKLNNSMRYCYHFTWMGSYFNNRTFKSIRNKTCSQFIKDKKTLCINPMVATYTGGEPDLQYILQNHAVAATCRLAQEQVCAKYTVYSNGLVSYVTRYCTQINIILGSPMKSGCVQEKRKNEVIEVCACISEPGSEGICNRGIQSSPAKSLFWTVLLVVSSKFLT